MNHNDSNVTIISSHLLSDPLKGYCLQRSFKKVLEEEASKFLGDPKYSFILDRRYYCDGGCEEGEYYDEEAKDCKQKTTRIYYANGILNSEAEAKDSLDILQAAKSDFLEKEYKHERFEFDIAYNYSYGKVKDILELIYQKQRELNYRLDLSSYDLFLALFAAGDLFLDDFDQLSLQTIQEYYAEAVRSEHSNTNELNAKLASELKDGKRAILVAHSQGNLFANQIMQTYESDSKYKDSIAMIGLGSPAGTVYNNTSYRTAHDDLVIKALRAKFPNGVLASNIDNYRGIFDGRGWQNHNFDIAYFREDLPSRAETDIVMKMFVHTLKFPNEKK
jgi:hypothetical protein